MKRIIMSFLAISFNLHAGWPVFDLPNSINQMIALKRQADEIKRTVNRINYEVSSARIFISKLNRHGLSDIDSIFRQIRSFQYRTRRIGYTYKSIVKQFEKTYGKKADFANKYQTWQKQSDDSIKDAMVSQGLLERSDDRMSDLDQVLKAKKKSKGNAETLHAIGEINAIQTKQLNDLTQIIATDARARHSVIMEDRSKQKELKQYEAHLMSDFNKKGSSRPLAYFPSLGSTAPRVTR